MPEVTPEEAPRKVREVYDKARVAMERGNLDYAIELFQSALELEPKLLRARKFLRAASVKRLQAKKKGAMTRFFSSASGSPALLTGMGQLKKNPHKALIAAEKLLAKDPLNMPFINFFGQAAVAAGLTDAALQTLELAKEFYPKDVALLNWLGKLYLENKDPESARQCFDAVCKLRPGDQKAIKALKDAAALGTIKQGGWEDASSFRDMIKDSKEATVLEQDNKAVKSAKDIESLIADTKKKIQQEPGNVNYRRALADLYAKSARFDEAIDVLEAAQKEAADPQVELSISRIKVSRFDAEIEAMKSNGDEAGATAKEQEKRVFQLEDAQRRVKKYPNDLQFRYELGVLLHGEGELNDAIQQFQLAQRNPQRRIRSLYYLAMCFKDKGQLDIAIEQLEKASSELFRVDDTKKDILYELGCIADAMGDKEKAAGYYKEIYAVDIGYKDIAAKIDSSYNS